MIKPVYKMKSIIILITISEIKLRIVKRLRGILRDFKELNKGRGLLCKEEQSKWMCGRLQIISARCNVQKGESFCPSLKA